MRKLLSLVISFHLGRQRQRRCTVFLLNDRSTVPIAYQCKMSFPIIFSFAPFYMQAGEYLEGLVPNPPPLKVKKVNKKSVTIKREYDIGRHNVEF